MYIIMCGKIEPVINFKRSIPWSIYFIAHDFIYTYIYTYICTKVYKCMHLNVHCFISLFY